MPTETKTYAQRIKARWAEKGHAARFIELVNAGEFVVASKADECRLNSCWRELNKYVPDMRHLEVDGDVELTINVVSFADGPDPE